MAKRGRPPKKKSVGPNATQQKITAHWKTQQIAADIEVTIANSILPLYKSTAPRNFPTESVVLPTIPKFELMPQIPLYHKPNQPVEGKIPLEEWSTLELSNFRQKLSSLHSEMKHTLDAITNEVKHIEKIRKEITNDAIPIITEASCLGELTPIKNAPRKNTSPIIGSLDKFQKGSTTERPKKRMSEHSKANTKEKPPTRVNTKEEEEISLPKPLQSDFIVPDSTLDPDDDNENGKSKRGRSSSTRKRRTPDTKRSDKKRRKKKKKMIDLESSEEEELAAKPTNTVPLVTSANFWATMEPYIAPLTPVDLKCLQPVDIPNEDEIVIPPLGKHYSLILQDKLEAKEKPENNDISCGDLTQRLLASLIETKATIDFSSETPLYSSTCLPLDVAPTADYSPATVKILEERIRIELRCIGLLDQDMALSRREDDEICSEIRLLQKQLRDRIESNNTKRLMFYEMAQQKMEEDRRELVLCAENRAVEQIYDRKQAKQRGRRRSKGRPRGRPPVTPTVATTSEGNGAAPVPFPSTPTPTKEPRTKVPVRKEPASRQGMEIG